MADWFQSMEEDRTVFTDSLTELLGLSYMCFYSRIE